MFDFQMAMAIMAIRAIMANMAIMAMAIFKYDMTKIGIPFKSDKNLTHQLFFLQEFTQNLRIQPGPVDLGILCHLVSI